jgi:hypothetical protein
MKTFRLSLAVITALAGGGSAAHRSGLDGRNSPEQINKNVG